MGALEKNQYMKCINAWGGKVKREFDFIIGRTKEVITSILYIVHIWRGTPGDAAAYVPDFDTLVPAPELSLLDAKNNPFRIMTTQLYRERQLGSGNESVEIRYERERRLRHLAFLFKSFPR